MKRSISAVMPFVGTRSRALRELLSCVSLASAVALAGCGNPPRGLHFEVDTAPGDTAEAVPETVAEETAPEVAEETTPETTEETGAEETEVVETTEPGHFTLANAELDAEYVFKAVWAGEAGRIVAVGNNGIVASRDPEGAWSVLTHAEGAELLNAVHGADAEHLWTVGKNGTTLAGTATSFGASGACDVDDDCTDLDLCTLDRCVDHVCKGDPTGAEGCCGADAAAYDFEAGTLGPWTAVPGEQVGPYTWSVVARAGRATSGTHALYFGNNEADPPTYDSGEAVAGVVASPAFKLPATGTATLHFRVFLDTEPDVSFDVLSLQVSANGVVTDVWAKSKLAKVPTGGFVVAEADLSKWRGQSIQLRVKFDSVDGNVNDLEGAYVDDVRVATSCVASGTASAQTGPTLWGVYGLAANFAFAVGQGGTILKWDGLTWSKPKGADASSVWNGVVGFGDTVVLVGNGGVALRADPTGVQTILSGTANTLHSVTTVDGDRFFAVGDHGAVVEGNGTTWTAVPTGLSVSLRGVRALANDDVYAVGYNGTILHRDANGWTQSQADVSTPLLGVWPLDATHVVIVGKGGAILEGNAATGFAKTADLYPDGDLNDVWRAPDGSLWACGTNGKLFVRRDTTWVEEAIDTVQSLESIWGTSATDIWVVGRGGTTFHRDDAGWTKFEASTTTSVNGVWGDALDRYYAVGAGGTVLVWNGAAWANVVSSTTANLRGVFMRTAGDAWAVGATGTVMHYTPFGWGKSKVKGIPKAEGKEDPIVDELHAVWAASATDAWAVGADGRVLHWDGTLWDHPDMPWKITLRGVYGLAPNDVWAVGNEGHVIHWNGVEWEKIETGSIATLHGIHGDGAGHVVIVGDIGTVMTLERD